MQFSYSYHQLIPIFLKKYFEFENSNRELFDNYKDLLFRIDDSIKVLKNGFSLAEVQEFNRIDSLNYSENKKKFTI